MIRKFLVFGLTASALIAPQSSVFAAYSSENFEGNNSPVLAEIRREIYPSLRRLTPLLNTWIVVCVLAATSTVTAAIVLSILSAQKIPETREKIRDIKRDTLSEFNEKISEIQAVVNELEYSLESSREKLNRISDQIPRPPDAESD